MSAMTATVERKEKTQKPLRVSKSSVTGRVPQSMEVPVDPFRYGFRYIEKVDDQGKIKWTQIPLTLDDVLHPEVGDFIVQSSEHDVVCDYVKNSCKHQTKGRPGTVALHDVRVDLNVPGVKPVGPDVALFFDVQEKRDWSTFKVEEEKSLPALIVEVTSPSTRHQDFGEKKNYYERAGVPIYVVIDKRKIQKGKKEFIDFQLHGFALLNGRYVDMKADERGWLWIAPIQSWLTANGPEIEFYDINGEPILDYEEMQEGRDEAVDAKQVAEARAQEEADARRVAEARAQELENAKQVAEEKAQSAEARAQELESVKQVAEEKMQSAEARVREEADARRATEVRAQVLENAKQAAEEKAQSAEARAKEDADAKQVAEEKAQAAEALAQEALDAKRAMEAELSRLRAMLKNQSE